MTPQVKADFLMLLRVMQANIVIVVIVFALFHKRVQEPFYRKILKANLFIFIAISIYFFYFIFSNHLVKF